MIQIIRNNIYLNRGDTGALALDLYNEDGSPFILPPSTRRTLAALAEYSENEDEKSYSFYAPFMVPSGFSLELRSIGHVKVTITTLINNAEVSGTYEFDELMRYTPGAPILKIAYAGDMTSVILKGNGEIEYFFDPSDCRISVLAFTVRSAEYGDIVLEKYLNLHSAIVADGSSDYSWYGWNKFVSQELAEETTQDEIIAAAATQKFKVYKAGDDYCHARLGIDGYWNVVPYHFSLSIPIMHEDTKDLKDENYVYDIILYQGYVKNINSFSKDEFPFSKVLWKKTILEQHNFTVGGSNNA